MKFCGPNITCAVSMRDGQKDIQACPIARNVCVHCDSDTTVYVHTTTLRVFPCKAYGPNGNGVLFVYM